jgi:hypothetical protein
MSPVLEAFLSGQRQQGSLLQQAQDVIDKREQMKQRQKAQEDLMSRFQAENDLSQKEYKLNAEKHANELAVSHFNIQKQVSEMMASGEMPIQQHMEQGNSTPLDNGMQIPGMEAAYQSGPTQVPVNDPTQTVNIPGMDPFTFGTPKTNIQRAQESQAAMLPGLLEQTKGTEAIKAKYDIEPRLRMMEEVAQAKADSAERIATDRNASNLEIHKAMSDAAQAKGELGQYNAMTKMFPGVDMGTPGAVQKAVEDRKNAFALGEATPTQGSFLDNAAKTKLIGEGKMLPPSTLNSKVFPNAANAAEFMSNIDNLKGSVGTPTSIGERLQNAISEHLGISGLSTYKSLFDMFLTAELPKLDLAVGLTPGTLARSPKLINLFKNLYPQPGDVPTTVEKKKANGVDIYMSGIQSQLTQLPKVQRQAYWAKIVDNTPGLLNNVNVADKLKDAIATGNYNPGSIYTQLISGK